MSLSEPPCLGKPGVLLGAGSRTLGLGGLAGLVFCSSASPHPPVLCVWPSSSRVKAWVSVPLALFSGLQCWALCGGVLRGIVQVKPTLRLKAKPSRMGHLGSPLGVVVSIPCAVCQLSILLFVMKLVNWLLGQLISRGLFVLHTLMLFNSKFLIKWKVLLEAREPLQQESG